MIKAWLLQEMGEPCSRREPAFHVLQSRPDTPDVEGNSRDGSGNQRPHSGVKRGSPTFYNDNLAPYFFESFR